MSELILKARNIVKTYTEGRIKTQVLRGASADIEKGMLTAIIGKSGSGKSTLLHIMGTLDTPDSGELMFDGQDLLRLSENERALFRATNLGFVYQFHHLLADFTALENVMMPLLIGGMKAPLARKRAQEYLERVGLLERINNLPSEMSGGERQRAAIARALCTHPKLVLADEPTGNLDAQNAQAVFELFSRMVREEQTAVVMVTHDNSLAQRCDRIYTIKDGQVSHE